MTAPELAPPVERTHPPRSLPDLAADAVAAPSASPRLDWRFLMAAPHLGRIGIATDVDPASAEALSSWTSTVEPLDAAEPATLDTIVIGRGRRDSVRAALVALAPGGTLRIEDLRRRRRLRTLAQLRDAGLVVSTWWVRPSAAAPSSIVSLDQRRAAYTVLRTVAGRGRRARVEALLARSGLAQRWAGPVAVLASHPPTHESSTPMAAPCTDAPISALIAPGFAGSRAVIGMATDPSGRTLAGVAKVARSRHDDELIAAEGTALQLFRARSPQAEPSVPGHPRLDVRHGRTVLVEDAAPGRPLDRRTVRRDPAAALAAGVAWLDAVPSGPASDQVRQQRYDDVVVASLRALLNLPTAHRRTRLEAIRRAARLLEPLRLADLDSVFEHGDFSHPNLFVDSQGAITAIDWERGRANGLPLHDLTFFTAYLTESKARPSDGAAMVDAYRRALRPGGWARSHRDLHAERMGVDPRLLPVLEVACWTRVLARLGEPGRRPVSADGHRNELLWLAAIETAQDGAR